MANAEIKQASQKIEIMSDLVRDDKVSKFIVNGFQFGMTGSEAHIILKLDAVSQAVVFMGMPALKSLNENLAKLIKLYEDSTKQKILTVEETNKLLLANNVTKL